MVRMAATLALSFFSRIIDLGVIFFMCDPYKKDFSRHYMAIEMTFYPTGRPQWCFVNPDMFVPGRCFRINEFSGLLNRPSVQKRKSVPALFVRISEISGLSELGLTNHHCTFIVTSLQKQIVLIYIKRCMFQQCSLNAPIKRHLLYKGVPSALTCVYCSVWRNLMLQTTSWIKILISTRRQIDLNDWTHDINLIVTCWY